MTRILLFLLLLSIHSTAYAQSFTQDELNRLLPRFSKCEKHTIFEYSGSNEISSDVLQKALRLNLEEPLELYAYCAKEYKFGVLLLIQYNWVTRNDYSRWEAILINPDLDSSFIRHKEFGLYADDSEDVIKTTNTSLVNDSIIEHIQIKYNWDGSQELDKDYQYFLINKDGIRTVSIRSQYSQGRKFLEGSLRILDEAYLNKLTSYELDIMRNEIYADYGYKFKTVEWQEYFYAEEWYISRFDNVDDKLTEIEKINVQSILATSLKK